MNSVEGLPTWAQEAARRHDYEQAVSLHGELPRERPEAVPAMPSLAYVLFDEVYREWDAEPRFERAGERAPTNGEARFRSA